MHPLLQLRLSTTFSSRQGSSRKCHLPLQPCFSEALFPWRGPAPKYLLHRSLPVPASPPLPPGGLPFQSTTRACPSNPLPPPAHPPDGAPTPRHVPHRPLPAPASPASFPPAGITPLNFFCIVFLSFRLPRCQKQTWGPPFRASWPRPGVFGLFPGFSGYFLGFSGRFLKKVGPKTSLFPPLPV